MPKIVFWRVLGLIPMGVGLLISLPATAPQEMIGSWSALVPNSNGCQDYNGWYPSFMSLNTKPGHLSMGGYAFSMAGCTGDASGSTSLLPPSRVFSSRAFIITTNSRSPCDLTQNGIINEALGKAAAVNDLTHDGAVSVADIEIVIAAELGTGCFGS